MIDFKMEHSNKSDTISLYSNYDYNYFDNNNNNINSTENIHFSTKNLSFQASLSAAAAAAAASSSTPSTLDNIQYSPILSTAEQIGDYLTFYYPPILVLTGSIGNILSVFVFFKTKLKKLSSSYYLAALAVSDTCFLFGVLMQWLNFIDIYLYNREILCQFFTFFSNLCSFLSVWFVVAFTVERFIAVMYPLKRQSMCTVKRAKLVLCGLIILGSLHCTPCIFFATPRYEPKMNATLCDVRPEYKVS